jgi:hypothetical protein
MLLNQEQTIDIRRGLEANLATASTLDAASMAQIQAQLNSEWQDIRAKLAKLDAEVTRRQDE